MIYAKSNTPEFGAGANTFNEVFGADAQSLEHVALGRRLLGRRGGGAGDRHGLARAWLRHGRLAAQPGELLRRRRPAAEPRPRGAYARAQIDRTLSVQGPDGAQCRGSGAAARRHERRASGRSAVVAAAAGTLPVRGALGLAAEARSPISPDLGITAGRSGSRRHHRARRRERFAEAGVVVEEAHPDLREAHECFQVLRAFDFAISRRRCCAPTRPAQARGDLEHRGRPEAHGRADRRAPKPSASR